MKKRHSALLWILLAANASAQTTDLRVTSALSRSTDLEAGQDILVSITIENLGPSATEGSAAAAQEQLVYFVFHEAESLTPECGPFEVFDIDPPQNNFGWDLPLLQPGAQITCVARIRISWIYPELPRANLWVGAWPRLHRDDPNPANNSRTYVLSFASPRQPRPVPGISLWSCAFAISGVLAGVAMAGRGACGGAW